MAGETIPVRKGEELDPGRLETFLRAHFELPETPLKIEQFSAGHSNLTYLIRSGNWEAVLRRPPLGPVAPKAHDMGREYKVLNKVHPVFPLAPRPLIYHDDPDVVGAPFFLMERRKGVVVDTSFPAGLAPTEAKGRELSQMMVDTLVQLHAIDYRETGMEEISKPQGFLQRQVEGWIKRYQRVKTDEITGVDTLTSQLAEHIPASPQPAIIHYDYKLNNVMFDSKLTKMVGLFDWEMATVGDPLADLGCALSYWTEKNDPEFLKRAFGQRPVTVLPGFMTREQWIEAYAKKSGRDLSHIHYYLAFAYFKLAVICQQIYYRWKKGQTQDERFSRLRDLVHALIQLARQYAHKC
ncbi:phosphotransferase family protein [Paenactinomyces guangxiensis]|uniref:Phosphotransferase family protein n=1 Tax=Paenactinomyces guangxiensis TaxID=1490290 RepID=A0A7W1WRN8_9BACL|nr:phosphotransferase family protein [Paenactinomyces guangxiensis]MBA4494699.1 phosphotransferase family protein [Paenactinomyces guangxiensis]MBH8591783.1 phosphotransferase family protein [Paenactinomyces guangxiensis]